ncbi:tetratricopeptide repeat protein [Methylomonas sp. LL1]|uniref:YfgM family protein n=1 Tax=Methylomonas sp. LL1 TaxID=2785785 RepID=UPI0018C407EF|nr:tetratricopeptide repeat protein [Methylomonas sp. LL1]QPK63166.1 tetratricopeptide repeat protein [Methylomonas sp. LL1]
MAIYDTEEEQVEQLKKWWEANNSSLIAGVATAVVLVAGWNFWQNHQLEQRSQASQMYQQLLVGGANNDNASVDKLADQLAVEHGSLAYSHFAALQKAKSKVQQGDLEAAKAILEQQLQNPGSQELQHVARLRLIQLMLASGQYEPGLKLIAEVDPASAEGFAASYDELEGDLYVAMDRLDEARNAYQSAIRSGQATPLTQFKLDDIATPGFNPEAAK